MEKEEKPFLLSENVRKSRRDESYTDTVVGVRVEPGGVT